MFTLSRSLPMTCPRPEDDDAMVAQTGCDTVMIGRSARRIRESSARSSSAPAPDRTTCPSTPIATR